MDEFSLIQRYFTPLGLTKDRGVVEGIGDDCAVLDLPQGHQLVVSIDTLVQGTHFLSDAPAYDLAWRLLGASVSDLAAMGAEPRWLTLALTLPSVDEVWLSHFSEGLRAASLAYNVSLIGGDTTRGPLTLTAQVHGLVETGRGLLRKGAKAGDIICVTGTLGDSRGGLETLLKSASYNEDVSYLRQRFYRPTPRVSTGRLIRGFASACIDLSDGLLGDIRHIAAASGVGVQIDSARLPISAPLKRYVGEEQARQWALSGGEDFELCFTLDQTHWETLQQQRPDWPVEITAIGQITSSNEVQVRFDGAWQASNVQGFNHFTE